MARIETDPNYSTPTFSRATAGTDIFKKEDVQALAAAMSTHVHDGAGKGLPVAFTGTPAGSIPGTALADGAVTSAKIADGTITVADIADQAVTAVKLAPDVPIGTNLMVNGGFEVYDRGNNTPTSVNGGVVCDRWNLSLNGTSTATASLDSSQADQNSLVCAKVVYTAGSGPSSLYQQFGTEWVVGRGKWLTLTARVRCSVVGGARITIGDGATSATSSTNVQTGGMETLSTTFFVSGANAGLNVYLELLQSATFYWDNVMLVVGQNAKCDYLPLSYAEERARCRRYYERIVDQWIACGYVMQANVGEFVVDYQPKGGAPTLTYGPAIGNLLIRIVGSAFPCTGITPAAAISKALINVNTATNMGTSATGITLGLTGGGFIALEWNP